MDAQENPEIRGEALTPWDHRPKPVRVLFPKPPSGKTVDRAIWALFPWKVSTYPGVMRLRAWLMGDIPVTSATAFRKVGPSKRVWLAMAQRLEAKAAELSALASECRAEAGLIKPPPIFRSKPRPDVKPPE